MKPSTTATRSSPSELLLRQRLQALTKALSAARKGDVSALHQARVASRRMRETLPLIAPGSRVHRLQRHIRRITRTLGPVRELDVASQMLDELDAAGGASRHAVARLRQAVLRERERLRADMLRQLDDFDVEKLRKKAIAAARKGGSNRANDKRRAERLARARLQAARRAARLRAAIENAAGIYLPDRLHDVRIAVKKLRYTMELVRELSRSRASARVKTLKRNQDLLGRMHDLEVLIARTRALQSSPSTPNLRISGELDRLVRSLETECRQLHGHYIAARTSLLAVCDHVMKIAARRHDKNAV